MRSYAISAGVAAVLVLAPVATGYAPAAAQDFTITNSAEAPGPGAEWIKPLQAWWDMHAYYPPDAAENKKEGEVKVHLVINPDGEVWQVEVLKGSGWQSIDVAAWTAFRGAHLRPIPSGAPLPQAAANLTLHYVLGHRDSRNYFTITDEPVHGTVVDANQQRLCTGTVDMPWGGPEGNSFKIEATFFRQPDHKPWVRFYWAGKGPLDIPLVELSVSPQWTTPPVVRMQNTWVTHYAVWPDGDNRLTGTTIDPYGTFVLTCGPAPE